ncbi:MAG: hypothetical protein QM666_05720 [Acinetobacter sp.]
MNEQPHLMQILGIDVWIPRSAQVQVQETHSLWRDHDLTISEILQSESSDKITLDIVQPEFDASFVAPELLQHQQETANPVQPSIENSLVEPSIVESSIELVQPLQLEQFHLHVLQHHRFVIITEQQHLTQQTQILWRNIKHALKLSTAELQWPFPLPDLQDGHAVNDYIQGFLDIVAHDKIMVVLGELPIVLGQSSQQLPSLQNMLDAPLLKSKLWEKVALLIE